MTPVAIIRFVSPYNVAFFALSHILLDRTMHYFSSQIYLEGRKRCALEEVDGKRWGGEWTLCKCVPTR